MTAPLICSFELRIILPTKIKPKPANWNILKDSSKIKYATSAVQINDKLIRGYKALAFPCFNAAVKHKAKIKQRDRETNMGMLK